MNVSAPFIDRPVATTLLTLGITLAGAVAFRLLPVSPLPRIDLPTITVTAALPGASPETVAATVAMPLERSLGRIAGVTEITSTSTLGATRIVLQFELERDSNGAARDVQAAINAARNALPSGLAGNPTYRKVNPAVAPIMILGLTSDTMTQGQMYDAASTIIMQKLAQIDGVGQVQVGGSSLPAVRVEVNPRALHKYGIGFEDVRAALVGTNANAPKGAVDEGERHWQVGANDQAGTAAEYLPLIVSYRNGAAVGLTDVAEVVDSVQDLRNAGSSNGKPSVLVIISRQPDANIIETVDRVSALLPALRASIPQAIDVTVMMERTTTIRASLRDAGRALAIAVALVILVVLLFLRDARAALIPTIAVPVSLTATFGITWLAGYSLDNLSLMALTIATGFVVDDAIVVVENVARHIENGMAPREAARLGAGEVGFTVLAMTLALVAVFIPMLFMGGFVGRFFREFAVTLSAAILVSLLVSLTTTPMLCARLLRPAALRRRSRLHAWSERAFAALVRGYGRTLTWALEHAPFTLLVLAATVGLNVWLYVIVPKGFFPQQDTGQLTGRILADQSISFQLMREKLASCIEIVRADPGVASVVGYTGGAQRNTGSVFVTLKPLAERVDSADRIVTRLRARLADVPGATLTLTPVQDIRVGGRQSSANYQYTIQADDLDDLWTWEPRIRQALAHLPELVDVSTDQQNRGLQTKLVIDRDAAARLGVTAKLIDATLNDAFAQRQVATIYTPLNQYHVVMGAASEFLQSPASLDDLHVSVPGGAQVPLAMFARYETTEAPLVVNHHSLFVAATISFNPAPGVSLSQATRAIDAALLRIGVPTTVRGSYQGSARAFRAAVANQPLLILAALVTLYIVLGVLYESFVHPLTILSTLPSAGVGAIAALMLCRTEFSVIASVGVIMLIGIVQKNAIMMIDFALAAQRRRNASPRDAIFEASILRLRPILMTTLAALLASVPLALGSGDGAEFRQPLGIAIGGGLIVSQVLTLYTTPVVYLYLDRFSRWIRERRRPRAHGAALAAIIAIGGCTVGPDYVRPPVAVPPAYKEARDWKPGEPRSELQRGRWWELFGDAQLDALVAQVDVDNQTLRAAEARVRQFRALTEAAQSRYYPTLVAGGTNQNVGLLVSWELDFWGRIRRTVEASTASAEAAADELEAARLSVQALVAQTYLLLRVQDAEIRLLQDSAARYERSLQLTRNQYAVGVASRGDVAQAETQLMSTRAQALEAAVTRAQLEHAIAVLIGKAPAELAIAATEMGAKLPAVPPALPSELLERRPDIAAAERRMAAANAQIGVAEAAYYPSVSLSAGGGFGNLDFKAGATYGWALFDGGLRQAQSAQASAAYDETFANYRQTILTAFREVEDNLVALALMRDEAEAQGAAVRAARESVRIVNNQYRAGLVSYLAVVVVQAAALINERAELAIESRRLVASVNLIKALGGGWQAPAPQAATKQDPAPSASRP